MISEILPLLVLFMFIGSVVWCIYYVKGCHIRAIAYLLQDLVDTLDDINDTLNNILDKL